MRRSTQWLAAAWLSTCMAAAAGDGVDLRPKFEPRRETCYRQTYSRQFVQRETRLSDDDAAEDSTTETTEFLDAELGLAVRVRAVAADGTATLNAAVVYIRIKTESPASSTDQDTRRPLTLKAERPGATARGALLMGLLNRPVTISVSRDGRVSAIDGADELVASVGSLKPIVEAMFSTRALRAKPLWITAGAKTPAPVGTVWEQTTDEALPLELGEVRREVRCELRQVDTHANVAEIAVSKTTTLKERPAGHRPTGASQPYDQHRSDTTGAVRWDLARGECAGARFTSQVYTERIAPNGDLWSMDEFVDTRLERVADRAELLALPAELIAAEAGDASGSESAGDAAGRSTTQGAVADQPTTQPTKIDGFPIGADGSPVLAYLGEQEITLSEIDEVIMQGLRGRPWPDDEAWAQRMRQTVLEGAILLRVYQRYAAEHPELVPEKDVAAAVKEFEERLSEGGRTLADALAESGQTMAEFRRIVAGQVAKRKVQERSRDEARIAEFYRLHGAGFDGARVTVKCISRATHPVLSQPEEQEAARAKLAQIKEQVAAGEMTFDEAVQRFSADPYDPQRPTFPPFPRYGVMDEAFAAAAFALQPGGISDPVRSVRGWHLIQVVKREPGTPPTLAQAHTIIRQCLQHHDAQALLANQLRKHPLRVLMAYEAADDQS